MSKQKVCMYITSKETTNLDPNEKKKSKFCCANYQTKTVLEYGFALYFTSPVVF